MSEATGATVAATAGRDEDQYTHNCSAYNDSTSTDGEDHGSNNDNIRDNANNGVIMLDSAESSVQHSSGTGDDGTSDCNEFPLSDDDEEFPQSTDDESDREQSANNRSRTFGLQLRLQLPQQSTIAAAATDYPEPVYDDTEYSSARSRNDNSAASSEEFPESSDESNANSPNQRRHGLDLQLRLNLTSTMAAPESPTPESSPVPHIHSKELEPNHKLSDDGPLQSKSDNATTGSDTDDFDIDFKDPAERAAYALRKQVSKEFRAVLRKSARKRDYLVIEELLRFQVPYAVPINLAHIGTLYALDKDAGGKFTEDRLVEFLRSWDERRKQYQVHEYRVCVEFGRGVWFDFALRAIVLLYFSLFDSFTLLYDMLS
jgi:hypothetical protein